MQQTEELECVALEDCGEERAGDGCGEELSG
jgi:hypothetical protein